MANILVASLGNPKQGRSTACTVLPWHQPHCGGEVSAASVLLPVAELRGEKTSGDGANTTNRQQALPEGVVGKLPLELFFDITDLLGKCSGEIDLKFGAVCAEQAADFVVDGFVRPSDEVTPMVFGLLPDDLDEIEFGTVWRQIEQLHAMLA